jgi:hypothetical protein
VERSVRPRKQPSRLAIRHHSSVAGSPSRSLPDAGWAGRWARLGPASSAGWAGRYRGCLDATAASRWVRICGMTCSVRPCGDRQPHWQLAWRCPLPAGGAAVITTLCPVTC